MSRIIQYGQIICPQCEARKNRFSSSEISESSVQSQNQIVALIKYNNSVEVQKTQQNINKLKHQIQQLKIANKQKDLAIVQLFNQYRSAGYLSQQFKLSFQGFKPDKKTKPDLHQQYNPLIKAQTKLSKQKQNYGFKDTRVKSNQELIPSISTLEKELKWMRNFIDSFIRSVEQISLKMQENIFGKTTNLKQRTKLAWKFIKRLIGSYFQICESR